LRIQQQAYPEMKLTTLFLTSDLGEVKDKDLEQYKKEGISGICISDKIASAEVIERAKKHELKVGVWVVDDTTRAHQLTEVEKIDYLISNRKLFV
jgi:glycerophosphoryl diester phosphodiesterase